MSALSSPILNVVAPRNASDLTRTVQAANAPRLATGTLVSREATGLVTPVDCTDLATSRLDVDKPCQIVWTDGITREDVVVHQLDGTKVNNYEVFEGCTFTADVLTTSFFSAGAAPADGDVVIKSLSEAGKADALTRAELQTAITGAAELNAEDDHGLIIGSVVLGAPSGFTRVRFSI